MLLQRHQRNFPLALFSTEICPEIFLKNLASFHFYVRFHFFVQSEASGNHFDRLKFLIAFYGHKISQLAYDDPASFQFFFSDHFEFCLLNFFSSFLIKPSPGSSDLGLPDHGGFVFPLISHDKDEWHMVKYDFKNSSNEWEKKQAHYGVYWEGTIV